MSMIKRYVEDRDDAMLAYPDTGKLDDLLIKYHSFYTSDCHERWNKTSAENKIITLELMIDSWSEAPLWLKMKVRHAREERAENETTAGSDA